MSEEYIIIDGIPDDSEFKAETFQLDAEEETVMGAFVMGDGEVTQMEEEQLKKFNNYLEDSYHELRAVVSKGFDQSTQSVNEIGNPRQLEVGDTLQSKIIEPPYPPRCLTDLIDNDSTASKSIETNVKHSTSRQITIKPIGTIRPDDEEDSDAVGDAYDHSNFITQEQFDDDCKKIQEFMGSQSDCGDHFEETCFKVFSDREAIGWGAFEVIRAASGRIAQLNHLPAGNLRRLRKFEGFVEIMGYDMVGKEQYTYYQNFGDKVVVPEIDPFDARSFDPEISDEDKPKRDMNYDPEKHGELFIGQNGIKWNLKDRQGNPTESFQEACNEVLFIPKSHRGSKYYGISPSLSVIAPMLANSFIDNHIIQYFEHNCVPRYAVTITGANADDKFVKRIAKFLSSEVKGNRHETLVLAPKSGFGAKVEVHWQKLDSDHKEQDFTKSYEANAQRIMTANGTSPAIIGINDAASLGSGKGMSQADNYKNRESLPAQLFAARKLNGLFRLGLGCLFARIQYDPLDIKDAENVARILQILLVQGAISINEARSELGKGPIKGGDVAFVRIKDGSFVKVSDIPELESQLGEMLLGDGNGQDSDDFDIGSDGPDSSDLPQKPTEE